MLSDFIFSPNETLFKEKPHVFIEFPLEIKNDPHQVCNSQFCKNLPSHSDNTILDQSTIVQPLLTEHLISYTLQIEKSMQFFILVNNSPSKKDYFQNQNSILELKKSI